MHQIIFIEGNSGMGNISRKNLTKDVLELGLKPIKKGCNIKKIGK